MPVETVAENSPKSPLNLLVKESISVAKKRVTTAISNFKSVSLPMLFEIIAKDCFKSTTDELEEEEAALLAPGTNDVITYPREIPMHSAYVLALLKSDVVDTPTLPHKVLMHAYMVDLFMGGGITSAISGECLALVARYANDEGEDGIEYITDRARDLYLNDPHMIRSCPPVHIPIFSFDIDKTYIDIILSQLQPANLPRFRQYIEVSFLAILPIVGFAGWRKVQTLSVATIVYMERFGKSYGVALSHTATTDFARRVYLLGIITTKRYREANPEATRTIPLVVRGYEAYAEAKCVMHIIGKHETSTSVTYKHQQGGTARLGISLSLAEWFLKLVQFEDWNLHELDDPELFRLRETLESDDIYSDLRDFLYTRSLDLLTEDSETDTEIAKKELQKKLTKQIIAIQECIAKTAGLICTTLSDATQKPYKKLHKAARAVMIDEAGAVSLSEASTVIGPYLRPLIIAGDDVEESPRVIFTFETEGDNFMNAFRFLGRVSILEHFKRTGMACFVPNDG